MLIFYRDTFSLKYGYDIWLRYSLFLFHHITSQVLYRQKISYSKSGIYIKYISGERQYEIFNCQFKKYAKNR